MEIEPLTNLHKRDPELEPSVTLEPSSSTAKGQKVGPGPNKILKDNAKSLSQFPGNNILNRSYLSANLALFNKDLVIEMLRKQLEFYLGDPNLKKDKYLQGFLRKNKKGYLDLTIFLGFNKIREIFMEASISDQKQKLSDLVSAIEKSDFLKVNSLQNRVKRVSKFELDSALANDQVKSDTDERTIYIENLPLTCSLADIVHIFRNCADIVHISLPRNHAKQIKGFAFIEFAVSPPNPNQSLVNPKCRASFRERQQCSRGFHERCQQGGLQACAH